MPSAPHDAAPASIDSPDMRHAGRDLLSLALMDARNRTLQLLAAFESFEAGPAGAARHGPSHDASHDASMDSSLDPPLWLAGHVGWFAEAWIGRNTQRVRGAQCPSRPTRLASIEPKADAWWNDALALPAARRSEVMPDASATRAYLLETLESTLDLLDRAPDEDDALYFFRLALFHEDMRCEDLLRIAQATGVPMPAAGAPAAMSARDPLLVPAARWMLGSPAGRGFVFDNERDAHGVDVPEFEIDAHAVSWSQYVEFVDDGGYDNQSLWLASGWDWLLQVAARDGRRGPRHVERIGGPGGAVIQNCFGRDTRMAGGQPVLHVSWWEADAWCRWAGRRLPTEVEWEMAAHVAARRGMRWGDAWEWTASTFRPWPGFVAGPWVDYSQPWFGRAKVLRGASFATRSRLAHPKFRGFALPGRDDGFFGFRSCSL